VNWDSHLPAMGDFLTELIGSLTWQRALLGVLVFAVTFVLNLAIVSFILIRIPANHFGKKHKVEFWSGPHPAFRAAGIIGKNILGLMLVALGIVLSLPGVPGQGLLTILLGIMLLDFPGKRRLEQKLLSRQEVVKSINSLRARFGRSPLELD
jgi:ABC-type phosphate transport system permease subunit